MTRFHRLYDAVRDWDNASDNDVADLKDIVRRILGYPVLLSCTKEWLVREVLNIRVHRADTKEYTEHLEFSRESGFSVAYTQYECEGLPDPTDSHLTAINDAISIVHESIQ